MSELPRRIKVSLHTSVTSIMPSISLANYYIPPVVVTVVKLAHQFALIVMNKSSFYFCQSNQMSSLAT